MIIDQDCAGPGGTDMQAVLAIVNSPKADVLGITVVTGDAWRDEEVQHTLRLLEIIGRTDIPVLPGAVFPIVNSKESTARWEKLYGKVVYQGAWNYGKPLHGPFEVPPMPEGAPTTKASNEDAAHFLIRMVRQYPHQVTIYAGGPLMNLALAQMIDPEFASLDEGTDRDGRKHPSGYGRSGIRHHAAARIQFLARSRIVLQSVPFAVAADHRHHRRHFRENEYGQGI